MKESNTIIPAMPSPMPSGDRTFTIKRGKGLGPGAKERAFCEKSPTKVHHFLLDNKGNGKCFYCSKVYGS